MPDAPAIPLTPAQGRIWADQLLRPGSSFYNINRVVDVDGSLDIARLERALTLVCGAHDSLRFRFWESGGIPFQAPVPVSGADILHVRDFSGISDPIGAAQNLIRREQIRPLDLVVEGPLRVYAVRIRPDRHILLFQTHHIVSDWWAGGVFFRALSSAYSDGALSRDPEAQYQSYIERQLIDDGRRVRADTKALASYLAPHIERLELPYRADPKVARRTGASVNVLVGDARSRLTEAAAVTASSEYMFLLAALACVLHRWTGSDEFTVGVYVADRSTPGTAEMVGLLFEGLPVRVAFDSATTFAEVLGQVRLGVLTLLSHPTADPEVLVKELGGAGSGTTTLFDVTFQMYPARANAPRLGDLRTRGSRLVQETLHDLMAYAHDGSGGLELRVQYDASLFSEDTVTAVLIAWRAVLSAALRDTSLVVMDLELCDSTTAGSTCEGARVKHEATLLTEVARSLLGNSERTALRHGEEVSLCWTYGQLSANVYRAQQMASIASPGTVVAIVSPVRPAMIAAWLALLQAGAVTLVLDPDEPGERFRYMLRDSGAELVICDETSPALAFLPLGLPRLYLDELDWRAGESHASPDYGVRRAMDHEAPVMDDEAPAALIYTSGSTGRPKGVVLSRFGLLNQAKHRIELLRLTRASRTGVTLPQHFVTFPLQVLSGLLSGSEITLFPRRLLQSPAELIGSTAGMRLDAVEVSVAGLDSLLFSAEQATDAPSYPHLRAVLVAGEKLRPRLARRFADQLPGIELVNAYGMTETTGMVASMVVNDPDSYCEGGPTQNCVLEIVDRRGRVVPRGWVGELRVLGRQISLGYWRKPQLNAERFGAGGDGRHLLTGDLARMTPDGKVEILGRMDDQLSLRGFRIEPAEIGRVIEAHPGVSRAELVLWPIAESDGYLIAYVVANQDVVQAELREHCLAHLPPAMVPRQFVRVEEYPRGRTGKLERHRLPQPAVLTTQARPPRSSIELALASIWREVLVLEDVSLDSDFFQMGGHSLAAVRVVARIDAALDVQLNANAVFEHPTLESLAQRVAAATKERGDESPRVL